MGVWDADGSLRQVVIFETHQTEQRIHKASRITCHDSPVDFSPAQQR
jgi:hypothetical protein